MDLAHMGATLARPGANPLTGKIVIPTEHVRDILFVMLIAGFYDSTGDWIFDVGLPGKSGVAGGVFAAYPHRCALAAFSPRLDTSGNSVRGVQIIRRLAERWKLYIFS